MNCREIFLDEVLEITAIPIEDYTGWGMFIFSPLLVDDGSPIPVDNAIVIGKKRAVKNGREVGELIPIRHGTGHAKDDESNILAGKKHIVTVSCEADDRNAEEVWPLLRTLEQSPRHLILTFRGGTQVFVTATEDTYLCEVSRDRAKTSVQFLSLIHI